MKKKLIPMFKNIKIKKKTNNNFKKKNLFNILK